MAKVVSAEPKWGETRRAINKAIGQLKKAEKYARKAERIEAEGGSVDHTVSNGIGYGHEYLRRLIITSGLTFKE